MDYKVLIIDDDARNIFALQAVLKAKKISCISTQDALEGISLLRENQDIDAVLLDMMMPEMDGYQVLSIIKEDKSISNVPVIAVTAQALTGDREKCLKAGADGYISKPVDIDQLLATINKLTKK